MARTMTTCSLAPAPWVETDTCRPWRRGRPARRYTPCPVLGPQVAKSLNLAQFDTAPQRALFATPTNSVRLPDRDAKLVDTAINYMSDPSYKPEVGKIGGRIMGLGVTGGLPTTESPGFGRLAAWMLHLAGDWDELNKPLSPSSLA
jgi:hypothetical protein